VADSVHLVEKLCSFYHLGIQRHSSERAGIGDRGGSAVGAMMILLLLFLQKQSLAFAVYLFGIGTLLTGLGSKKKHM
jgi:hypothetical protein